MRAGVLSLVVPGEDAERCWVAGVGMVVAALSGLVAALG